MWLLFYVFALYDVATLLQAMAAMTYIAGSSHLPSHISKLTMRAHCVCCATVRMQGPEVT